MARLFCFLLALLVITGALVASVDFTERIIRPVYLGIMLVFFLAMGLIEPGLRSQGWRFLVIGLTLLSISSLAAVLVNHNLLRELSPEETRNLAWSLEHGVGFLLGFSVLSFGFVLWVPEIVRSQKILKHGLDSVQEDQRQTTEKLRKSMRALDRANDDLIQAERLAAVGELAAGVAHDLRNPLAIIRSAAQSCLKGDRSKKEIKQTLQVIQRSVDKADQTIKALLEMGRPANFEPTRVAADALVEETLTLARVEAEKKGVNLIQAMPMGAQLWGDHDLLAQVLLNLCLNAIQATPGNGLIRVGARTFTLGPKKTVLLFVEDTGAGIAPENQRKIFDPFFTTKTNGTGLGLTMCQRVIARHDGRLDLRPRGTKGTRALILVAAAVRQPVEVPI